MPKFIFGHSDYDEKMVINADNIKEAKTEFAFACGDVSRYTYKGNHAWKISDSVDSEPYGFTNGKPNEDYNRPNFYQRIKIRHEVESKIHKGHKIWEECGEITVQEIELILATPDLPLLSHGGTPTIEGDEVVYQSRGIMMLRQQSRQIQLSFRNKQLELVQLKAKSGAQLSAYNEIKRHTEKESKKIQEKIDVLQTYSGIGKDIVKVHSGENSKLKQITIFQSFRYMKEDMELLSDFEDFDYKSLDSFDSFLAENYKELIPTELSIQAFKISKFPILYKTQTMFGEGYSEKEENHKIFIVIRNGDNVYRMFNNYQLNGKLFHSEDEIENTIKKLGAFRPSVMDDLEGKPVEFWEITGEGDDPKRIYTRTVKIPTACAFYPDLDSIILDKKFQQCEDTFNAEIARRQKYINDNELNDLLHVQSWRWGRELGYIKQKMFEPYHELFYRMYIKEAFKIKDYASAGALDMMNGVINQRHVVDAIDNTQIYPDDMYLYGYSSSYDKDLQLFNPLSGASFSAKVVNCSKHFLEIGFFEEARKKFMENVWVATDELHLKNFHAVAILQNILDNRKMFPDHEADFITGEGMEQIHRVYDDENMIPSQESKDRISPSKLLDKILSDTYSSVKVGDEILFIKTYEYRTEYSGSRWEKNTSYKHKFNTERGDKPFTHQSVNITYFNKSSITAEGMVDTYGTTNYNKRVWAGDPKMGKVTVKKVNNTEGSDKLFISKGAVLANLNEMKTMMKRREFREKYYLSHGVFFKHLIKAVKSN